MSAHRSDLAELRRELRLGFAKVDERFAKIDERFAKIDERFARMDGRMDAMQADTERMMEKALREQTRFFFLAWAGMLAAIIGLYARG